MSESKVFEEKDYQNIIDYVYHYGDSSFRELPFNDLDNAVFSAFSYIPFEEFEKKNSAYSVKTVSDLCLDYLAWININYISSHYPDWLRRSIFLAMAMFRKKRYQDCKVTHFRCHFSEEDKTQFGALCILLDDGTGTVVYRGTDNSILGWREDFNLACYESVPGQLSATRFLQRVMKAFPETEFRVMGHSKGGNLAVYAASSLPKNKLAKIIRIYSNDGPGLTEMMFDSSGHKAIEDKVTHIVVEEDVVGGLLCHEKAEYVVVSSPKNDLAMQHDLYNWHVKDKSFVKVKRVHPLSKYITDSVNDWLKDSVPNPEIREEIVRLLFTAQAKTNFNEAGQVLEHPAKFFFDLLHQINKLDKVDKKLLNKSLLSLFFTFTKNNSAYLKDKAEYNADNKKKETKTDINESEMLEKVVSNA